MKKNIGYFLFDSLVNHSLLVIREERDLLVIIRGEILLYFWEITCESWGKSVFECLFLIWEEEPLDILAMIDEWLIHRYAIFH